MNNSCQLKPVVVTNPKHFYIVACIGETETTQNINNMTICFVLTRALYSITKELHRKGGTNEFKLSDLISQSWI